MTMKAMTQPAALLLILLQLCSLASIVTGAAHNLRASRHISSSNSNGNSKNHHSIKRRLLDRYLQEKAKGIPASFAAALDTGKLIHQSPLKNVPVVVDQRSECFLQGSTTYILKRTIPLHNAADDDVVTKDSDEQQRHQQASLQLESLDNSNNGKDGEWSIQFSLESPLQAVVAAQIAGVITCAGGENGQRYQPIAIDSTSYGIITVGKAVSVATLRVADESASSSAAALADVDHEQRYPQHTTSTNQQVVNVVDFGNHQVTLDGTTPSFEMLLQKIPKAAIDASVEDFVREIFTGVLQRVIENELLTSTSTSTSATPRRSATTIGNDTATTTRTTTSIPLKYYNSNTGIAS